MLFPGAEPDSPSRRCKYCGNTRPKTEFREKRFMCKPCLSEYQDQWRYKNMQHCRDYRKTYKNAHGENERAATLRWRREHPENELLMNARRRAKVDGLKFELVLSDIVIPATCPVLGIELARNTSRGAHHNSPTLDRVVPSLGYVAHNVRVISWRANRLKSDATPEELRLVSEYAARETMRAHNEDEARAAVARCRMGMSE